MGLVETKAVDGDSWAPLAITLAMQAMVAMAVLAVPVMAPKVGETLGVSPTLVGVYIALAYAGAMAASLAAGAAVARYGSIRVSQACLVLCAMGLAVCAVPAPGATAIGAVMIGLGYGPITPASSHLLARTTPAHRMSLVFSVKQTGVPLGGALAGAVAPGLAQVVGWQGALFAAAATSLVCALLAQGLRREFDADRDPARPLRLGHLLEPVRLVLLHPDLRRLAICSFVFSVAQQAATTFLVAFLTGSLAYGLVAAGALMSLSQMGGVFGRIFWGYLSDRWLGARPMLALLALLMAACALATAMLHPQVPVAIVSVVLIAFGACATGWNGVYLAQVARQAPAGMAGMATGGTLAITFLGVVLGPPVFGAFAGWFGSYRPGFAALAVPLVFCALALRPDGAAPGRAHGD